MIMLKKLIKCIVIVFILLIILIVTGYYVFINWFAKDMIESQIEKAVHRDVEISEVSINILSLSPEIIINDLMIANTPLSQADKANQSNTIDEKERFVNIKALHCLVQLMPLMNGQIELSELLVKEPYIKVIRHPNGKFNFSDLLGKAEKEKTSAKTEQSSKPTAKPPEKQAEKKTSPEELSGKKDDSEPHIFSADDLPFQILIGKVGIDNAHIYFLDTKYQQAIHLKKLKLLLNEVNINPKNLEKENTAHVNISTNIKTEGQLNTGWVKTVDIDLLLDATITAFNVQTRLLDPLAIIKIGSPSGVVSGLQIYESIRSILMNYEIKALDFLKKDLEWNDGIVQLKASQQVVHFTEGSFKMDKLNISTDGKYIISKKAVDFAADILLDPTEQDKIKTAIRAFIADKIDQRFSRYVSADKISQNIIDSLTSTDGQMHLIFAVSGPVDKPEVKLVHPQLPALDGVVSKALAGIKDQLSKELKQKAAAEIDKLKQKATSEMDKLKKKGEGELDKLKDKYLDQHEKDTIDNLKDNLLKKLPFSF